MHLRRLLQLSKTLVPTFRNASTKNIPELTQIYHNVKRGNYSQLSDKDIKHFETVLGAKYVLQDGEEDLHLYNIDYFRTVRGNSKLVLKPGCTQEISEILKYCNQKNLAICTQGGNTSVVGGGVAVCDEIVLSTSRLNKVISIDEITGIVTCEAGCILENLDNAAREMGLIVPLDLGAKSSCHIGGNLSTNAGGLRVLRYGNLQGSVLGIEAVLANGQVLNLMSDFKKDNTGYHLKHLFIGSEGTLGVVTKLSILCPSTPKSVNVALLGLNSFDSVLQSFLDAKRNLGEILSACEMFDAASLEASSSCFNLNTPIQGYPFYMLIETSGSNENHDREKLETFLEYVMAKGTVLDGTYTGDIGKMREIWKLREFIPIACTNDGCSFNYDVSLPLRSFYDLVTAMNKRCGSLAKRVCGFGHLGDSNLHITISSDHESDELYRKIEPYIYETISSMKGSISAEHGIGFLKRNYLHYSKNEETIQMMRDLKMMFDPKGILNPYKIFK